MTENVTYSPKGLDPLVIPMVEYFNEQGLETCMSCQGHDNPYMSIFWIQFAPSVTENDILNFMHKHLTAQGTFVACGRFAERILGFYDPRCVEYKSERRWCYFAASAKAADEDLYRWKYSTDGFDGVDGERYQAFRNELKALGKI